MDGQQSLDEVEAKSEPDPAESSPPEPEVPVHLCLLPWSAVAAVGENVEFRVSAYGELGQELPCTPVWHAEGGDISVQGLFVAGRVPGTYTVQVVDGRGGARTEARVEVVESRDLAKAEDGTTPENSPSAFHQLVEETAAHVEKALPGLSGKVRWSRTEHHEYFDLVLTSTRQERRCRFHLKLLPACSPEYFLELFKFADAELATLQRRGEIEDHAYLILAQYLFAPPGVEKVVGQFNEIFHRDVEAGAPTAFFAFADLQAPRVRVPQLTNPWPALDLLFEEEAAAVKPAPAPDPELGPASVLPTPPIEVMSPPSRPPPSRVEGLGLGPRGSRKGMTSVLVVDDDLLVLRILSEVLLEAGYQPVPARSWAAVREAVFLEPFAVILMDVGMPEVSGDRMASFIRKYVPPPTPSIVFHSGLEASELRRLTRETGVFGFLCKGCEESELLATVEAAIEAFRSIRPS